MRIFSVAQPCRQWQRERKRRVRFLFLVQEIGDRTVVFGSLDERLDREPLA